MRPVRYVKSIDGTSLAWTRAGHGKGMVKAANWLTHLEYQDVSPVWAHWNSFFEGHFDFVQYDERGCGMSERTIGSLAVDDWVDDLKAVADASELPPPFCLLGISQGAATAIGYAVKYPQNVSQLVLYGGYARGANVRGEGELYKAIVDVFRLGWGKDNPGFQDVFTSRFIPGGTPEQRTWYNDLCEKCLSPDTGAELLLARAIVNVDHLLPQVTVPTLVVHVRGDQVVPVQESERLARGISGAKFVVLEGRNHIIQKDEPAWSEFCSAVEDFTGSLAPKTNASLRSLTPRETEILRVLCEAKSNKQIARELGLSEKTVRNHVSNILAKLKLSSRQEAILLIRTSDLGI